MLHRNSILLFVVLALALAVVDGARNKKTMSSPKTRQYKNEGTQFL